MTKEQKPYEILDHDKWQAWREICPVKCGLSLESCFMSGKRCALDNCVFWRFRALVHAEGRP